MVDFKTAFSPIRCTCPKGMVEALKTELLALGYSVESSNYTGITTHGTLKDCMYLNLHLRCCHKVLYQLKAFQANNPDELYEALVIIPWESYLTQKAHFTVENVTENAHIKDTRFANLKVKDAIADRFQQVAGKRPNSRSEKDQAVVFLFWKGADAMIYIDTSGQPLSRHGYRKRRVEAPLSEALAAALVLTSEWNPEQPFVNPMCGSGTLAIEAAMMAINRPPGLMRETFGFMYLKGYQNELWHELREAAKQQVKTQLQPTIIAADHDPQAIRATQDNARRAGVLKYLFIQSASLQDTPLPEKPGVIMMNPPYGTRMGETAELADQYQQIGDFLKHYAKGYQAYVFTGNQQLAKHIGLKTDSRTTFYNGKLECRLLSYSVY